MSSKQRQQQQQQSNTGQCAVCGEVGTRPITKEQPIVLQEREVTVWQRNPTTNKPEQVKKIVKRPKTLEPLPHESQKVQNAEYQFDKDGFVMEKLFPICSNLHKAHYSCIRNVILDADSLNNTPVCPLCRYNISGDFLTTMRETSGYKNRLKEFNERNLKIKKFETGMFHRSSAFDSVGSMLYRDEMVELGFDEDLANGMYVTKASEHFNLMMSYYIMMTKNGVIDTKDPYDSYNKMFKGELFESVPFVFKKVSDTVVVKKDDAEYAFYMTLRTSSELYNMLNGSIHNIGSTKLSNMLEKKFIKFEKEKEAKSNLHKERAFWYIMVFGIGFVMKLIREGKIETFKNLLKDKSFKNMVVWIMAVYAPPLIFSNFEITKYMYEKILNEEQKNFLPQMYPIPLYGLSKDFSLWLYNKGFVFTRFAVYKKGGRKFDDYNVSIPVLLFFNTRIYDTDIKTITNFIVRGSGIDKSVAEAIATVSYENNDNDLNGTVRFELGPFYGKDVTIKQWNVMVKMSIANQESARRHRQNVERQRLQDREGYRISELLFNELPSNYDVSSIYENINNAITSRDLEKYYEYRFELVSVGVMYNNFDIARPDRHPWLRKLKGGSDGNKIMYYIVLFDLSLNNIILTGEEDGVYNLYQFLSKMVEKLLNSCTVSEINEIMKHVNLEFYLKLFNTMKNYDNELFKTKEKILNILNKEYTVSFGYLNVLYESIFNNNKFDSYQSSIIKKARKDIIEINNGNESMRYEGYAFNKTILNSLNSENSIAFYFVSFTQSILEFIFKRNGNLRSFGAIINAEKIENVQIAFDKLDKNGYLRLLNNVKYESQEEKNKKINAYKKALQNANKKISELL